MPAIVLPPGESPAEQALINRRQLGGLVMLARAESRGAEQLENLAGRDGCHVAALLIEPERIAPLGDSVADESGARRG